MAQTVTITRANALKAYKSADKVGKKLLTDLIPELNTPEKITDRIKTLQDAIEAVGVSEDAHVLLAYAGKDADMIAARSALELTIIARALNEDWEPDWSDSSEYKYYPWFNMSGSGVSYFDCDRVISTSAVGSRLCYKSRELAEYAAKQFQSHYNNFMTL
ncbi:MAG: hypothetical protein WC760_02835 [Bacteroidia bacterium]|jgi:hypothetical protein